MSNNRPCTVSFNDGHYFSKKQKKIYSRCIRGEIFLLQRPSTKVVQKYYWSLSLALSLSRAKRTDRLIIFEIIWLKSNEKKGWREKKKRKCVEGYEEITNESLMTIFVLSLIYSDECVHLFSEGRTTTNAFVHPSFLIDDWNMMMIFLLSLPPSNDFFFFASSSSAFRWGCLIFMMLFFSSSLSPRSCKKNPKEEEKTCKN